MNILDKLFRMSKHDADYFNEGLKYYNDGKYEGAILAFNKAIKLNPNDATAYFQHGLANFKLGRNKEGFNDFKKVLYLNPVYWMKVDASYNCGVACEKLGQYENAIEYYNMATEINPTLANAHCNKGNMYVKIGKIDLGIDSLNKAISLNGSDAFPYFNLAIAYNQIGRYEEAVKNLEMFLKLAPQHPYSAIAKMTLSQLKGR